MLTKMTRKLKLEMPNKNCKQNKFQKPETGKGLRQWPKTNSRLSNRKMTAMLRTLIRCRILLKPKRCKMKSPWQARKMTARLRS